MSTYWFKKLFNSIQLIMMFQFDIAKNSYRKQEIRRKYFYSKGRRHLYLFLCTTWLRQIFTNEATMERFISLAYNIAEN